MNEVEGPKIGQGTKSKNVLWSRGKGEEGGDKKRERTTLIGKRGGGTHLCLTGAEGRGQEPEGT